VNAAAFSYATRLTMSQHVTKRAFYICKNSTLEFDSY